MLRTKSDIAIFQSELQIHQRNDLFTEYHPYHLSRSPITRPDSGNERCRIEHDSHIGMISPVVPRNGLAGYTFASTSLAIVAYCMKEVPS